MLCLKIPKTLNLFRFSEKPKSLSPLTALRAPPAGFSFHAHGVPTPAQYHGRSAHANAPANCSPTVFLCIAHACPCPGLPLTARSSPSPAQRRPCCQHTECINVWPYLALFVLLAISSHPTPYAFSLHHSSPPFPILTE